jgi:hypothetical protein
MKNILRSAIRLCSALTIAAAAACSDATLTSEPEALRASSAVTDGDVLATLRRVTAEYHRLEVAMADGFVLLHPCESRPGEGPVGIVYVHFARLLDGVIDPALPDALIYEPASNGQVKLVGVEFAIPYGMAPQPPTFMGAQFQPEDEFGVYALHAWVWRENPEGMFAETNPRVSCGEE